MGKTDVDEFPAWIDPDYSFSLSIHHPGSQPVCRITQGAGSLPCALRVTASQDVRPHIA